MRTCYARHGSKLDIDQQTYTDLWRAGTVAVHYPVDARGWREESDATSTNPEEYTGSLKSALSRMHELAESGGYICAEDELFDGCLVGYVHPDSEVELVWGRWGEKVDAGDRQAILKDVIQPGRGLWTCGGSLPGSQMSHRVAIFLHTS